MRTIPVLCYFLAVSACKPSVPEPTAEVLQTYAGTSEVKGSVFEPKPAGKIRVLEIQVDAPCCAELSGDLTTLGHLLRRYSRDVALEIDRQLSKWLGGHPDCWVHSISVMHAKVVMAVMNSNSSITLPSGALVLAECRER